MQNINKHNTIGKVKTKLIKCESFYHFLFYSWFGLEYLKNNQNYTKFF